MSGRKARIGPVSIGRGPGAQAARHEGRPVRRGRQHHAYASRLALSNLGADRSITLLVCHAGISARAQRLLRATRSPEHVREPTRADEHRNAEEHRNTVGPRAAHRHHAVPHHVMPSPCCWLRHVGARDRQDRRPHLRDGPGPDDAALLQILAAHHVPATFFLTGVHSAAQPAQVRALAQAGELVADHSYDHRYPREVPGGWTVPYLLDQITRTNAVLTSQTKAPVCFFRPPGGFKDNVLKAASAEGMTAVLWSVDSSDWKQPDHVTAAATQAIVAAATNVGTQTHPIVLLHSAKASHEPSSVVSPFRGNTLAALPQIIDWYATHGYRFVDLTGRSTGA